MMRASTIVLLSISLAGAAIAVYGGVTVRKLLLGFGIADAFLAGIFVPVIHIRTRKKERIRERRDALLLWQYSAEETDRIARQAAQKTRKSSVGLSILLCFSLVIIFAPFAVIAENPGTRTLLLCTGAATAVLPFSIILFAPLCVASQIRRQPSLTLVGRDYILVNNRYLGINDRAGLTLRKASVTSLPDGASVLSLTYTFRMKYGHNHPFNIDVPIPKGRLNEVEQLVNRILLAQSH